MPLPDVGRVLFELLAWAHPTKGLPSVLLECDIAAARPVQKLLGTYKLHAEVEISDASEHWAVCAILGTARPGA